MNMTMDAKELLAYLYRHQVELRAEGGRLHVHAPKGTLTAELRTQIGTHKAALLQLLDSDAQRVRVEFPLSEGQRALWFLNQLVPEGSGYNFSLALLLRGPLSLTALTAAVRRLGELHPLLRARFHAPLGVPHMRIEPDSQLTVQVLDVRHRSLKEIEAQAQALAMRPYQLSSENASRIVLLVHSPTEAVLLFSMHHIIMDYWSLAPLIADLTALYRSERNGDARPVTAPPATYDRFVESQNALLAGPEGARQRAYWHNQLAGELPVLDLLTDHPRPPIRTERGEGRRTQLGFELAKRLRHLAISEAVTPYAICVSGLVALLHRHTRQQDILLGTPYHGRSNAAYERTVGCFINFLVLRARVAPSTSFRNLVKQLHGVIVDSLTNADYPFSLLVESLCPRRDPSRNPIYQITVDWLRTSDPLVRSLWDLDSTAAIPFADLQATNIQFGQVNGVSDQIWMIADDGQNLTLNLGYSTDLFDGETAAAMSRQFVHLLEDATLHPEKCVAALELVTAAERSQVLTRFSRPLTEPADPLLALLAASASQHPNVLALCEPGAFLSYHQLEERANHLASFLHDYGVRLGCLVALYLDQPRDFIVSVLAVLKIGGVCIPIDTQAADSHAAKILQELGDCVLLTREPLQRRLSSLPDAVICLDSLTSAAPLPAFPPLSSQRHSGELAYVLYNNEGETPRGTCLELSAISAAVQLALNSWGMEKGDRVLLQMERPISTVLLEVLTTLCAGGTLVAPSAKSDYPLGRLISEWQITTLMVPAAVLSTIADADLTFLRRLIIHGRSFSPGRNQQFREDIRTFYTYGYPETSEYAAGMVLGRDQMTASVDLSEGGAILLVLDEQQRPAPDGMVGELYIGGAVVARGYLNKERLTAERFMMNPFPQVPGSRLFRTGILARYRYDGVLQYAGPAGEGGRAHLLHQNHHLIERLILSNPKIRDCHVTTAIEKSGNARRLVYVVAVPGACLSMDEVLDHLRKHVPLTELPSRVIFMDQLPIDRFGCIEPQHLPAALEKAEISNYVGPRDPLEQRLVEIWEHVLKRKPIGIRDDFFALGGHSLIAVQVRVQVQESLQKDIPLSALHQVGTVEGLAKLLRQDTQSSAPSPLVVLRQGTRRPLFLFHPIGGGVLCYVELARHLPDGDLICGLQSPALDPSGKRPRTLEELAAHYVAAIRSYRPEGPYRLAGWSLGGIMALEAAQQLTRQGAVVEMLTLIDSPPPDLLDRMSPTDAAAMMSWLLRQGHQSSERGALSLLEEQGLLEEQLRIYRYHRDLLSAYSVLSYPHPVTLILSTERRLLPSAGATRAAWQAVCTGLGEVHMVPGDHFSLLAPEQGLQSIVGVLNKQR